MGCHFLHRGVKSFRNFASSQREPSFWGSHDLSEWVMRERGGLQSQGWPAPSSSRSTLSLSGSDDGGQRAIDQPWAGVFLRLSCLSIHADGCQCGSCARPAVKLFSLIYLDISDWTSRSERLQGAYITFPSVLGETGLVNNPMALATAHSLSFA